MHILKIEQRCEAGRIHVVKHWVHTRRGDEMRFATEEVRGDREVRATHGGLAIERAATHIEAAERAVRFLSRSER